MELILEEMREKFEQDFIDRNKKDDLEMLKSSPEIVLVDGEILRRYDYELMKFLERGNLFCALQDYYEKNSVSLSDQSYVFSQLFDSLYSNTLFYEGKYLINPNCPIDHKFVEFLLDNGKYHLLSYLIKNKDDAFLQQIRENASYRFRNTNHCEGILKNFEKSDETKRDFYDQIFDDLCFSDKYFYTLLSVVKNTKMHFNENNLISIYKNLYLYGIVGKYQMSNYNKPQCLYPLVLDRTQEKDECKILIDGLAKLQSMEEGKELLENVIATTSEETKIKIKNYQKGYRRGLNG